MTRVRPCLLLVATVLALSTPAAGRAASDQYNIHIVAIGLAGRQTNLTHDLAACVLPPDR